ncbi:hypothetical protein Droror1_Dr00022699 [Drosera rotundifolia]
MGLSVARRKRRLKADKPTLLPRATLASLESLTMPIVQEVVISADIRCKDCQNRIAAVLSRMTAENLGLRLLSPYLDTVGTNFTQGANFATAGSTIRLLNVTWHNTGYSPVSLLDQNREFGDFHWRAPSLCQGVYNELLPTR